MGALNRTKEFIDRPVKKLLLVEDDDNQRMSLSARGIHRTLRVARTIADLAMVEQAEPEKETGPDRMIGPAHLAEALQLRRSID